MSGWVNFFPLNTICHFTLCLLGILSYLGADIVKVGNGNYYTGHQLPPGPPPSFLPSNLTPTPPGQQPPLVFPKVSSKLNKPPITNKWWSSLIWADNTIDGNANFSEPMFPYPLSLKANQTQDANRTPPLYSRGLEISYVTTPFIDPYHYVNSVNDCYVQEYHYIHNNNELLLGIVGLNADQTLVDDYSDWAVTASWSDGVRKLKTTMGTGFPFVYAHLSGGDALITLGDAPLIWSNQNGVIGLTIHDHHYGIFAPEGSVWTQNGNTLQSNLNNKDYLSIAILPDNQPSTLEFFRTHAYAFVKDTRVTWDYHPQTSQVTATYSVETVLKESGPNQSNVNQPLLALFLHQWSHSPQPAPLANFSYISPHGTMKLVDASQFTLTFPYQGVLPYLPSIAKDGVDTYENSTLKNLIKIIKEQPEHVRWENTGPNTDTYLAGKTIARIAHLIPIADEMGNDGARDLFLSEVKDRLNHWYKGQNQEGKQQIQAFYYDKDWSTLIGYPASFGTDTQLNDHHFHYGYFIMASAIVAKFDPDWAALENWGGMVELLIKDVANPDREDSKFPFLRNFDVYTGHSWASGPAPVAAGNNEESSSEDINFICSLIQWGALTGNKEIRNLGVFMYSLASAAMPQYWFNVNSDPTIFPPGFIPPTLGILWANGGAYAKFFPGPAQTLHGINFLPLIPGMLYLDNYPSYLNTNITFMLNNHGVCPPVCDINHNHTNIWPDIMMNITAFFNPTESIATFNNYLAQHHNPASPKYPYGPNDEPMDGESPPHTYHWIHNMNQLGRIDPTVTADIATYAVFKNETTGIRYHVAFNPSSNKKTINFSDKVSIVVDPYDMGVVPTAIDSNIDPTYVIIDNDNFRFDVLTELRPHHINIIFVPKVQASDVLLRFQIQGKEERKIKMKQDNIGTWLSPICIQKGETILFKILYQSGKDKRSTKWYKFKFK